MTFTIIYREYIGQKICRGNYSKVWNRHSPWNKRNPHLKNSPDKEAMPIPFGRRYHLTSIEVCPLLMCPWFLKYWDWKLEFDNLDFCLFQTWFLLPQIDRDLPVLVRSLYCAHSLVNHTTARQEHFELLDVSNCPDYSLSDTKPWSLGSPRVTILSVSSVRTIVHCVQ